MSQVSSSDGNSVSGRTSESGGETDADRAQGADGAIKSNLELKLDPQLPESQRRRALIQFLEENEQSLLLEMWADIVKKAAQGKDADSDLQIQQELLPKLLEIMNAVISTSNIDHHHSAGGDLKKEVSIVKNDFQNERIVELAILLLREALLLCLLDKTGVKGPILYSLDSSIIFPGMRSTFRLFSDRNIEELESYQTIPKFRSRMSAAVNINSKESQLLPKLTSVLETNNIDWSLTSLTFPSSYSTSKLEDLTHFYEADLLLIDISNQAQIQSLLYHIGIRESYGQTGHILIQNGASKPMHRSKAIEVGSNIPCITYNLEQSSSQEMFCEQLQNCIKEIQSRFKNSQEVRFISALKNLREKPPEKKIKLENEATKEDLEQVSTPKTILEQLHSFRDTQDYESMINLVDSFNGQNQLESDARVVYLYAFALNRRNKGNDREKALECISKFVPYDDDPEANKNSSKSSKFNPEDRILELHCLYGRIYKDEFVDSDYVDTNSLQKAITWYRRAYQLPNLEPYQIAISGINLMTLLVVSGVTFSITEEQLQSESQELQNVGLQLNYLIGKKGKLSSLRNYWDLATFFELSILTEDWTRAQEAVELIGNLKPSHWCVKSTLGNVKLIQKKRSKVAPSNDTTDAQNADIICGFVDALERIISA